MNAKHTPGPWLVGANPCWIFAQGECIATAASKTQDERGQRGKYGKDLPYRANAKLIAAAPDMLAALIAQEELAALRFEGEPEEAITRIRNMRRAAIAKATA